MDGSREKKAFKAHGYTRITVFRIDLECSRDQKLITKPDKFGM